MSQLDRFDIHLPIFPERFASTARLLENRSMPDIDFNVVSDEPFVRAARTLLGEESCYPMVAYGTMQEAEAFRNVCRSKGLEFEEFNDVAKTAEPRKGDVVYIERKKTQWLGNVMQHKVVRDENLYSLSQSYGIRLKSLAKLNRLRSGEDVKKGDIIRLK